MKEINKKKRGYRAKMKENKMKAETKEKVETTLSGMTTNEEKYKKAYVYLLNELIEWIEDSSAFPDEVKNAHWESLNAIFGEDHEEYIR